MQQVHAVLREAMQQIRDVDVPDPATREIDEHPRQGDLPTPKDHRPAHPLIEHQHSLRFALYAQGELTLSPLADAVREWTAIRG